MLKQLPSEAQELFVCQTQELKRSVCCCLSNLDCNVDHRLCFLWILFKWGSYFDATVNLRSHKDFWMHKKLLFQIEISRWWFCSLLYYCKAVKHLIYVFVPIPTCRKKLLRVTSVIILFSAVPMSCSHSGFAGRSSFWCVGQMDLGLFCCEHWAQ